MNLFLSLSTSVELIRSRPGLRRRPVQLVFMFVTCGVPRQLEICHIYICNVKHLIILVEFTHLADIVSREVGDVEGGGWGKPGIEICPNL